jgi:hypothetical protein
MPKKASKQTSDEVASLSGELLSEADDVLKGLRATQRAVNNAIAECPLREAHRQLSAAIVYVMKTKKVAASALSQRDNQ